MKSEFGQVYFRKSSDQGEGEEKLDPEIEKQIEEVAERIRKQAKEGNWTEERKIRKAIVEGILLKLALTTKGSKNEQNQGK